MSVTQFYQQGKDKGVSVVKQYRIPLSHIVVRWENNLRPLDTDHVTELELAYGNGDPVSPIRVFINEDNKPELVEGFHRYAALRNTMATATVCDVLPNMTKAQAIALMYNSASSLPLTALQKAEATVKLSAEGLSKDDMANALHVTKTAIEGMLLLGSACAEIKQLIIDEKVSATTALEYIRKFEGDALKMLLSDLERAAAKGAKKLSGASGSRTAKFSYASLTAAMEILTQAEYNVKELAQQEGEVTFTIGVDDAKDLVNIIESYDEYRGE